MNKWFLLIDCNNFFVSAERVFNPGICNKPTVVLSSNDGCVISRSPEAKKMGIPMGLPYFKLEEFFKKAEIEVFSSNFSLYGEISKRVMQTLFDFGFKMEIYSIDEAFLEVSLEKKDVLSLAKKIQMKIRKDIGIPVSIGIAKTKTLAKAANKVSKIDDLHKGILAIFDSTTRFKILSKLKVGEIWGIGRKNSKKMNIYRIFTAYDLLNCDLNWLKRKLTITGLFTVKELNEEPCLFLNNSFCKRKGLMCSASFGKSVILKKELFEAISTYAERVSRRLRKQKMKAGFMMVFVATSRFSENRYFNTLTFSWARPTNYTPEIIYQAKKILNKIFKYGLKYKKVGIFLGKLTDADLNQTDLFLEYKRDKRKDDLMKVVDKINTKFGLDTLIFASSAFKKDWASQSIRKSPNYVSSWGELPKVKI